jgi:hypothetical protein
VTTGPGVSAEDAVRESPGHGVVHYTKTKRAWGLCQALLAGEGTREL